MEKIYPHDTVFKINLFPLQCGTDSEASAVLAKEGEIISSSELAHKQVQFVVDALDEDLF